MRMFTRIFKKKPAPPYKPRPVDPFYLERMTQRLIQDYEDKKAGPCNYTHEPLIDSCNFVSHIAGPK